MEDRSSVEYEDTIRVGLVIMHISMGSIVNFELSERLHAGIMSLRRGA